MTARMGCRLYRQMIDILSRDQTDIVANRCQLAIDIMSTRTGPQTDQTTGYVDNTPFLPYSTTLSVSASRGCNSLMHSAIHEVVFRFAADTYKTLPSNTAQDLVSGSDFEIGEVV